jgi:hypothetical protein
MQAMRVVLDEAPARGFRYIGACIEPVIGLDIAYKGAVTVIAYRKRIQEAYLDVDGDAPEHPPGHNFCLDNDITTSKGRKGGSGGPNGGGDVGGGEFVGHKDWITDVLG